MTQDVQLKLGESAIRTFRLRGITPNLLSARLSAVSQVFGPSFLQHLSSHPIEDVSSTGLLCERGAIIAELVNAPGIRKVAKDILAAPEPSLSSPDGPWFQLTLAASLQRRGAALALEQSINGSAPKDIVFPDSNTQIECKAFQRSHAMNAVWGYQAKLYETIETVVPSGNWKLDLKFEWTEHQHRNSMLDTLKGATTGFSEATGLDEELFSLLPSDHQSQLTGPWPKDGKMVVFGTGERLPLRRYPFSLCTNLKGSLLVEGPRIDEFRRVYDALTDKRRQMLDGWINIIGLDAADLGGDVDGFRNRLISVLQDEDIREVSGILLVHRTSTQHHTHLSIDLTENSIASFGITPALKEILKGDIYWT